MQTQVSIQAEPVLDPRGAFRRQPVSLAPRIASLKGKHVLLFDNTQLTSQLPVYGPIFRWLSGHLQDEHGAACSTQTRSLLKEPRQGLAALAGEIAQSGVHAVVVALCNAGITQPTSLFAAELELRGVPCVQICTELGYPLAGVTASNYVPGLPIVLAQPASGDPETFGKAETAGIAPEVASGLTSDPTVLLARFQARFSSGDLQLSDDGTIALPPVAAAAAEIQGRPTVRIDPGRFAADLLRAALQRGHVRWPSRDSAHAGTRRRDARLHRPGSRSGAARPAMPSSACRAQPHSPFGRPPT